MSRVHKEVEDIMKNGPRDDDLMKIKESFLKDYDEDIEKNGFWLNTILFRYYVDQENYVMNYLKEVNNLSSESIQKTLNLNSMITLFFKNDHFHSCIQNKHL